MLSTSCRINRSPAQRIRAASRGQLPAEDKVLLETAASVVLHGVRGALNKQLEPARLANEAPAKPTKPAVVVKPPQAPPRVPGLTSPPLSTGEFERPTRRNCSSRTASAAFQPTAKNIA